MAIKGYCGNICSECCGCNLDKTIPCSPDCENLTEDGKIKVEECLKSGCEEVKHIFGMEQLSDMEVIASIGQVANYPYCISDDE